MARNRAPGRKEMIGYLNNNADFRRLLTQSSRSSPPQDLSTPQLKRYFGAMQRVEKDGRGGELRDLAELRGHAHSEHHRERTRYFKPGYENYIKPARKKSGEYPMNRGTELSGSFLRVTRGESVAVRALAKAASLTRSREGYAIAKGYDQVTSHYQVTFNLTGSRDGQVQRLFDKGGYDPALILAAAGYERKATKRGRPYYVLRPGGQGLESYLLEMLNELSYSGRWSAIKLYEIYAWSQPIPQVGAYEWTEKPGGGLRVQTYMKEK